MPDTAPRCVVRFCFCVGWTQRLSVCNHYHPEMSGAHLLCALWWCHVRLCNPLPHIFLSPHLPLSFHPSVSPPPLCWFLAHFLSLNFLVILHLISYPDSSCLSSLAPSLSLSAVCPPVSIALPLNPPLSLLFASARCPPFPKSSSFLSFSCCPLRSLAPSGCPR